MKVSRRGVCSIVIVNYRGAPDTIECLSSVRALDWPSEQLEVIVVDNDSGDGSADRIRQAAPWVTLVESKTNCGFAAGCNLGVGHSQGEFVAFINSDARPDPGWLREATRVMDGDPHVACVASKVVDWDGEHIDYVGGQINFAGQGYKLEAGRRDDGQYDKGRNVLFPTGSAAVVRADAFREIGGFDEQFFMFYEDVDLGWRLNLRGHRVRYVPESVVFHRHHAAIDKFGSFRESYLLARNSLLTIYKNFGDETLRTVLGPALLLAVHNGVLLGGADPTVLDLQHNSTGDDETTLIVDKQTLTGVYGVDYLARNLDRLHQQRVQIQRKRVQSDIELAPLFGDLLQGTSPAVGYHKAWVDAIQAFGLRDKLLRRRVLVITGDTLSNHMAGPAIRALNIAEVLGVEHDVKLVSTIACSITHPHFECLKAGGHALKDLVAWSDIVVFQGFVMHQEPWLEASDKILVVDVYDPMHLEQLEQTKAEDPILRSGYITATNAVINQQLQRGDFFLCATDEQRHFWLGQLAGLGRLNPDNYDRDPSLRSLLDVAPFGFPSHDPVRTGSAIKGVIPGISANDKVILWGGGVYNWFDPLTLIRAIDQLRNEHDDVRLYFLGMKHPNPNVPEMRVAWDTQRLAEDLGLTNKFVFFNEHWVEYSERHNYLLDADLGVSTHFEHVETTFSFRTRMLDYLWAELPIVATEGDAFARLIDTQGLGITVPEMDVDALRTALERVLYDEAFRASCIAHVRSIRDQYRWERTLEPLAAFCRQARPSADRSMSLRTQTGALASPFRRSLAVASLHYRAGGVPLVVRRGLGRVRRMITAPVR